MGITKGLLFCQAPRLTYLTNVCYHYLISEQSSRSFFVLKSVNSNPYAYTFMPLTLGIALALSAALSAHAQATDALVQSSAMPQSQSVEAYVREYFADTPVMAAVAQCESRFRQYDKNGSVLRGEAVAEDVGVMQVNETYHKKTADKLGLNLHTMEGNVSYARYLYEKEGTVPWNSSKKCWSKKPEAHIALAK